MSRQEEKMQAEKMHAVPVSEKSKEMTDVEQLQQKIARMREAQKAFAAFTQEQVDKIFFEAAMAANKQRIPAYSACKDGGGRDWHGRCGRQGY